MSAPFRRPALVIGILAAALALACSRRPGDPVEALLVELEGAAEARDAEAFGAWLSPQYRDEHGLDRAATIAQLRRWFAGYETIALEVYGTEIDRSAAAAARVRCVVEFSGQGRRVFGLEGLLPPSATYRFTLDFAEEAGAWRVRGAAYEPVLPAADTGGR